VLSAIESNTIRIQDADVRDVLRTHRERNKRVSLVNNGISINRVMQYAVHMHNIAMSGVSLVCVNARTLCELEHETNRDTFGEWRCDIAPQQCRLQMSTRLTGITIKLIRNVVETLQANAYMKVRIDPIFLDTFVNLQHLAIEYESDNEVVYL